MPFGEAIKALYQDNALLPVEGLQKVRESIVHAAMFIFVLGGPILLGVSLLKTRTVGWQWVMSVHVAAFALMSVAVLIRKRLSYEIQTLIIVMLLFLIGCGNLLASGLMGTFGLFFMGSVVFATVFAGVRSGVFVMLGSVLFIAGTGHAQHAGWITFPMMSVEMMKAPSFWASYSTTILFLTWGCIAVVGSMFRAMRTVLVELSDRAREAEAGRQRFESIFMSSPEAMAITDARTGEIVEINNGFTNFLGFSKEESIGRTAFDLELWEDLGERDRVFEALAQETGAVNMKVRFRRREGELVFGMLSAKEVTLDGRSRILFMSRNITEQVRAEQKLLDNQQKLRALANRLTIAEEQERQRIASELHDCVIQQMALSKIKIERFFNAVDCDSISEPRNEILTLLDQAIGDARSLLFEISPPVLNLLGLEEAVKWLGERFVAATKIPCHIEIDGVDDIPDDDIRIVLYQAVREMLNNINKYAEANHVELQVTRVNGGVVMELEDDGVGFEPAHAGVRMDTLTGYGLFSIRERIHSLGGNFEIDSAPGRGARMRLTIPV